MGLMYLTVIGFMVFMGLSAGFIMHYLITAFDSTESTKIDPKPETNF